MSTGIIKALGSTAVALFTLVSIFYCFGLRSGYSTTFCIWAIAIYTLLGVWTGRNVASLSITLCVAMAIWVLDLAIAMTGPLVNMGEGKLSFISVAPVSSCSTSLFLKFILIEFAVLVLNTQALFRLEDYE